MSRRPAIDPNERLLSARECAGLVGISERSWRDYARRWPALVEGFVPLRLRPGTRGRDKWLYSAVHQHMTVELRQQQEVVS